MKATSRQPLCALLAAILLTFAGCGTAEETSSVPATSADNTVTMPAEEETAPVETEAELPALPTANMNGWEMRFLNYDDSYLTWAIHPLSADEVTGDAMNDEIYERNSRLSETYNCIITDNRVSRPDSPISVPAMLDLGHAFARAILDYIRD